MSCVKLSTGKTVHIISIAISTIATILCLVVILGASEKYSSLGLYLYWSKYSGIKYCSLYQDGTVETISVEFVFGLSLLHYIVKFTQSTSYDYHLMFPWSRAHLDPCSNDMIIVLAFVSLSFAFGIISLCIQIYSVLYINSTTLRMCQIAVGAVTLSWICAMVAVLIFSGNKDTCYYSDTDAYIASMITLPSIYNQPSLKAEYGPSFVLMIVSMVIHFICSVGLSISLLCSPPVSREVKFIQRILKGTRHIKPLILLLSLAAFSLSLVLISSTSKRYVEVKNLSWINAEMTQWTDIGLYQSPFYGTLNAYYLKLFASTPPYDTVGTTINGWSNAPSENKACRYTMPIVFVAAMIAVSAVIGGTFCAIIAFSGILSSHSKVTVISRSISALMSFMALFWSFGAVMLFRVGDGSCYQDFIRSYVYDDVKLGRGFMIMCAVVILEALLCALFVDLARKTQPSSDDGSAGVMVKDNSHHLSNRQMLEPRILSDDTSSSNVPMSLIIHPTYSISVDPTIATPDNLGCRDMHSAPASDNNMNRIESATQTKAAVTPGAAADHHVLSNNELLIAQPDTTQSFATVYLTTSDCGNNNNNMFNIAHQPQQHQARIRIKPVYNHIVLAISALSFLAVLLSLCATSLDGDMVQRFCYVKSSYELDSAVFYYYQDNTAISYVYGGLSGRYIVTPGDNFGVAEVNDSLSWRSLDDACRYSMPVISACVYITFIVTLVGFVAALRVNLTPGKSTFMHKIGVLSSSIAVGSGCLAVVIFGSANDSSCVSQLRSMYGDVTLGPGFWLLVSATVLQLVQAVFHASLCLKVLVLTTDHERMMTDYPRLPTTIVVADNATGERGCDLSKLKIIELVVPAKEHGDDEANDESNDHNSSSKSNRNLYATQQQRQQQQQTTGNGDTIQGGGGSVSPHTAVSSGFIAPLRRQLSTTRSDGSGSGYISAATINNSQDTDRFSLSKLLKRQLSLSSPQHNHAPSSCVSAQPPHVGDGGSVQPLSRSLSLPILPPSPHVVDNRRSQHAMVGITSLPEQPTDFRFPLTPQHSMLRTVSSSSSSGSSSWKPTIQPASPTPLSGRLAQSVQPSSSSSSLLSPSSLSPRLQRLQQQRSLSPTHYAALNTAEEGAEGLSTPQAQGCSDPSNQLSSSSDETHSPPTRRRLVVDV